MKFYDCVTAPSPRRVRIFLAIPAPLVNVRRSAGLYRDRADADITEIDVPAFVAGFRTAAAGEGSRGRGGVASGDRSGSYADSGSRVRAFSTASGSRSIIVKYARAVGSGENRPCSQSRKLAKLMA
jgi:hypothetical protein